jgi:hypothetical protein
MTDDDKVGYKHPPKTTQFRQGQSGNPKGRPKGTRNLKTDLEEELYEQIRITTQGGGSQKMTKQRGFIKYLFARALKGDMRAAALILNMRYRLIEPEQDDQPPSDLSPEDARLLQGYLQRHARDGDRHE